MEELAAAAHDEKKAADKRDAEKKTVGKPSSTAAKKRPACAIAQSKPVATYSVERTRSQVQCKTGLKGPGQYRSFSFGKHGGEANATKLARQWVADHNA